MSNLTVIAFCLYLSVVVAVALVAYLVTKNLSDFVLGGRSLGGPVAALSAGASDMSAWLLLGLPGAVFAYGLNQVWLPIGLTVGAYLSWRFIAKPLRIFSEYANDSLTVPSYLDNRFGDDKGIIRILLAIITLVFFAFYTASGLVGGAMLLQRFGMDYTYALWLGTAIIVAYTFIGGFLAVSWTDFFQGILMFIFLIVVPIMAVMDLGGFEQTSKLIHAQGDTLFDPFNELNWLLLVNLLSWGLGYFGQPHILVRFMAVRTLKDIPLARRICVGWMSLSMVGAVLVGFVGIAYFADQGFHKESIFIMFSQELFTPWLSGILFAAILSSIMCAIDSQMLASSSALTEDIYHKFRKSASQSELMWIGRVSIIALALIAVTLASDPDSTVIDLVAFAWAGLGASFGPSVLLSLFWGRMTKEGAIAGITTGALSVVGWKLASGGVFDLYEIIPGFGLGLLAIVLVSLLTPKPSEKVLTQFATARQMMRSS